MDLETSLERRDILRIFLGRSLEIRALWEFVFI